jgi:membrane-bound lytic murein transglycosylase F
MRVLFAAFAGVFLSSCADHQTTQLEKVKQKGELVVVTRNGPTTYYQGPAYPGSDDWMGPEHDLARMFADYLGVELKVLIPRSFSEVFDAVASGKADLAAAGLTVTEEREQRVRFGPPYQEITQQVVYRLGTHRPKGPQDLTGGRIAVVAGSSHAERLRAIQADISELTWTENSDADREQLMQMVWEEAIDYTVADSNEVALARRFLPELRVAFDLAEPRQLAWAFPLGEDDSLYAAAVEFFQLIRSNGQLAWLLDRYYGHTDEFDYVGTRTYHAHIEQRLPRYREVFEEAGDASGIDWRLLAAMGYQESHWNADAVSPTGVRGIMMLTRATASEVGVKNRTDPTESILGGARYFAAIKARLPERITEPDRTWLALAAYNVGLGHLEDARVITQRRGGNPDKWLDVKASLPLLTQEKWYTQTRNGYARGREPVRYVDNVRTYYDILVRALDRERPDEEFDEPLYIPIISPRTLSAM